MESEKQATKIVGIGAATLDCLTFAKEPTPGGVGEAKEIVLTGGGPVATALVAAARLGVGTRLIDSFASDPPGLIITQELKERGIIISNDRTATRSAVATISVSPCTGERTILFRAAEAPPLTLSTADESAIRFARILHLNGRHLEAATAAAKIARDASTLVSFDGGAGRFREAIVPLAFSSNILIVAREFAESACGKTADPEALIRSLEAICSADLIVITDGISGSWVLRRGCSIFHQPAFPVKSIVDTTGCGDAYHGVFLAGLVSNKPDRTCAREASAAASLVASAPGGRAGLPDHLGIAAFLSSSD